MMFESEPQELKCWCVVVTLLCTPLQFVMHTHLCYYIICRQSFIQFIIGGGGGGLSLVVKCVS